MPLDQAVQNEIMSGIYAVQQTQKARINAVENIGVNPDQAAKEMRDAQLLGLPVPRDKVGLTELNRRKVIHDVNRYAVSPAVRDMLADRDMSRLIANSPADWDRISLAEQIAQAWKQGSLIGDVGDAVKRLRTSQQQAQEQADALDMFEGELDPETRKFIVDRINRSDSPVLDKVKRAYEEHQKRRTAPVRYVPEEISQAQKDLSSLSINTSIQAIQDTDNVFEQVGIAIANPIDVIGNTLISSIATDPFKVAAAPIAGAIGGPLAAAAFLGSASFTGEFGSTFVSKLQDAGVDVSDPEAIRAAIKDGTIAKQALSAAFTRALTVSAVDAGSVLLAGAELRPITAVNRLRQAYRARQIAADVAAHPTVMSTETARLFQPKPTGYVSPIKPIADTSAKTKIWEDLVAQGILQSAMGAGGEALGSLAIGDEINPADVFLEAIAELGTAPIDIISARGKLASVADQAQKAVKARNAAEQFDQITETIKQTDLAKRSPEVAAELAGKMVRDTPAAYVTVDVADLGDDVARLAQAVPKAKTAILEAQATGGTVALPYADMLRLSFTDEALYAKVRESARFGTEAMSLREAEEVASTFDVDLQKAAEKVYQANEALQQKRAEATLKAKARLRPFREALLATGSTEEQADASIAMMASLAASIGGFFGKSADQVLAENPVTVEVAVQKAEPVTGFHQEVGSKGSVKGKKRKTRRVTAAEKKQVREVPHAKSILGNFDPTLNLISLFKNPNIDRTTFVHESAHYWLNTMLNVAESILARPAADKGAKNMSHGEEAFIHLLGDFLRWGGMYDPKTQTIKEAVEKFKALPLDEQRPMHEKFADAFVEYVAEGRLPGTASGSMRTLFSKFKAWLKTAYVNMRRLHQAELSPDVAELFDKLFVSEQAIAEAQARYTHAGVYDELIRAGLSDDDFRSYVDLHQAALDLSDIAIAKGYGRDAQLIANASLRAEKGLEAEYQELLKTHKLAIMDQPGFKAKRLFSKAGLTVDGVTHAYKIPNNSLEGFSKDIVAFLRRRQYSAKPGREGVSYIAPGAASVLLGFESPEAMFRAMMESDRVDVDALARELADNQFLVEHGETHTPAGMRRLAAEAIHNDARLRIIATEYAALKNAAKQSGAVLGAVKVFVKDYMGKKPYAIIKKKNGRATMTHISPKDFRAQARRADDRAFAAFGRGRYDEAAAAKHAQLLQEAMAEEAVRVAAAAQKFERRVKAGIKSKTIDGAYHEQITRFANQLGFKARRRKNIADWDNFLKDHQELRPLWMNLSEDLQRTLLGTVPTQWELLTNADIAAADKFFDAMIKQGRTERTDKKNNAKLNAIDKMDSARGHLMSVVKANNRKEKPVLPPMNTRWDKIKEVSTRFIWAHIRGTAICGMLDGNTQGPITKLLVWAADKCGNSEVEMSAAIGKKLEEALAPISSRIHKTWYAVPGLPYFGGRINLENAVMLLANYGNEGNRDRLYKMGVTDAMIQQLASRMHRSDIEAVQKVWDIYAELKEEEAALERRVNGVEPDWAEATPFDLVSVEGETISMKGGYIPIRYDPHQTGNLAEKLKSLDEQEKAMLLAGFTGTTTLQTYTKQRADQGAEGMRLNLSLSVLTNGLSEVVHDLAWREWITDANNLLKDHTTYITDENGEKVKVTHEGLLSFTQRYYGEGPAQALKDWVKNIATEGRSLDQSPADGVVNQIRQGVSIAGLGLNVVTALIQVTGLVVAATRVSPKYMLSGIRDMATNPKQTWQEISNRSSLMRNRRITRTREIADARARIANDGPFGRYTDKIYDVAYAPMLIVQGMVDRVVWTGAYQQAVQEQGLSEAEAIQYADRMVIDTQGSGMVKDSAQIENWGALGRLFTAFYSFMGTALSLNAMSFMGETSKAKKVGQLLTICLLLPTIEAVIRSALQPGDDDDTWDRMTESEKFAHGLGFLAGNGANMLLGQFILTRELAGAAQNFFSGDQVYAWRGPAAMRAIADLSQFMGQLQGAISDGEVDEAFVKSFVNLGGSWGLIPAAAQINRSIQGTNAYLDDKTDNPMALLLGYKK